MRPALYAVPLGIWPKRFAPSIRRGLSCGGDPAPHPLRLLKATDELRFAVEVKVAVNSPPGRSPTSTNHSRAPPDPLLRSLLMAALPDSLPSTPLAQSCRPGGHIRSVRRAGKPDSVVNRSRDEEWGQTPVHSYQPFGIWHGCVARSSKGGRGRLWNKHRARCSGDTLAQCVSFGRWLRVDAN